MIETEVKRDKQGRVLYQGVPLRDRRSSSTRGIPFRGQAGKPHPRAAKLEARQKAYDADKPERGYRRPGSYKK